MNIYVGNLAPEVTEEELREVFGAHGEVTSTKIVRDSATGESRKFGFVEMSSEEEAKAAIDALNGKEVKGSEILVEQGRGKPAGSGFGGRRPRGVGGPRGSGRPGRRPGGRPGGGPGRSGRDRGPRSGGGRPRY